MLLIHFEPALFLQLLASTVFPLLVGLVTTRDTHPGRRAVLLALLSVSTSFAAQLANALQAGAPFDLIAALLAALVSFLVAVGMHFGLWNPIGAAALLQSIGSTRPAGVLAPALTPNPDWQAPADGLSSAAYVAPRVVQPAIPGTVLPDLATVPAPTDPGLLPAAPVNPGLLPDLAIHDPAESFTDPARPPAS